MSVRFVMGAPAGAGQVVVVDEATGCLYPDPAHPVQPLPAPSPESQCAATTWKGSSHKPYGPGGYNRCTLQPEHIGPHVDDWGHVFVILPTGKAHTLRHQAVTRAPTHEPE